MATPDQYKRTDPYQTQLQKQANDAAAAAAKKKSDAATAEKNKTLTFLKTEEARQKAFMNTAQTQLAPLNKSFSDLKKAVLLPSSDGGVTITSQEQQAVNYLGAQVAAKQTELDAYTKAYKDAAAKRAALEKQLHPPVVTQKKTIKDFTTGKKPYNITDSTPSLLDNNQAPQIPNPLVYYYNAPMVSTSYLNGSGPQSQTTQRPITTPGNVQKASDSWADSTMPAKGIIQMDSSQVFNNANYSKNDTGKYDGNLYGFKFLYNPKEVNMTWAVAEGMNWEGIQAGLDPGTAPTTALNNSTISFSLLLNRINDMPYLSANGLAGDVNPYPTFNIASRSLNEELAQIYQKGTMYDLEYLFKSIAGLNSTYTTAFNDISSDVGWLYGFSAELHLGNKMRYKVRLTSLDVNHAMFDERMVPILSYVNVTFARFPNINAPK
jgi:hypothetical protein